MLLSSVKCEVDRVWSDSVLTLATNWLWHSLVGPALHRMASKGRRYIISLCQFHSSQVHVVCTNSIFSSSHIVLCSLKVMAESVSSICYIHLCTCLQLLLPLVLYPHLD